MCVPGAVRATIPAYSLPLFFLFLLRGSARDVEPDGVEGIPEGGGGLEGGDVEAELLALQHRGGGLRDGPAGAAGLLPDQVRVAVRVRRVLRRRLRREPRHRPALPRRERVHAARVRLRRRREVPDHRVQVRRRLAGARVREVRRPVFFPSGFPSRGAGLARPGWAGPGWSGTRGRKGVRGVCVYGVGNRMGRLMAAFDLLVKYLEGRRTRQCLGTCQWLILHFLATFRPRKGGIRSGRIPTNHEP